jgi:hypothetical protein
MHLINFLFIGVIFRGINEKQSQKVEKTTAKYKIKQIKSVKALIVYLRSGVISFINLANSKRINQERTQIKNMYLLRNVILTDISHLLGKKILYTVRYRYFYKNLPEQSRYSFSKTVF